MVREILAEHPAAAMTGFIVWLPMLRTDNEAAAGEAARLSADPRVHHFYDPSATSGRMIAAQLGGRGYAAWDVYLVYSSGVRWTDGPPIPADWLHQLHGSFWADEAHYRTGPDLDVALRAAVTRVLGAAEGGPRGAV